MKNIFNIILLLVVLTSCSKDDNNDKFVPIEEIPANQKFIQTIDRDVDDLAFDYNEDKTVKTAWIGHRMRFDISYQGNHIDKIQVSGGTFAGIYEFTYNNQGEITGWHRASDNVFFAIEYFAYDNSYNHTIFMYDDGSMRRLVTPFGEQTIIYDTTKKGILVNSNSETVIYLMLINQYEILWPVYAGAYPSKTLVSPDEVIDFQNTYDSQGFPKTCHINTTGQNLDLTYDYIKL